MDRAFEKNGSVNPADFTTHLFCIGIDKYKSPIINKLNNAVKDATDFANILQRKYGIEKKNTYVFLNEHANRENILNKLEDLEQNLRVDENIIIFFAGHGGMNYNEKYGYWLPYDAEKKLNQYILNSTILDIISGMQAHHVYLIADTCFSGTMLMRSSSVLLRKDENPSRRVFSSGAIEVVPDGNSGENSPFASRIIEFLELQKESFLSSEMENFVIKSTKMSNPLRNDIGDVKFRTGEMVFHPISISNTQGQTTQTRSEDSTKDQDFIDMVSISRAFYEWNGNNRGSNESFYEQIELLPYAIGKYPITQEQWIKIMKYNPSHFNSDLNCPVENVSWIEVQAFIRKVNALCQHKNYRLAYEVEWEFAAKGGVQDQHFSYSGGDDLDKLGWYWRNSGEKQLSGRWNQSKLSKNMCSTHRVGLKRQNSLGIYDMSGNVWEYCREAYNSVKIVGRDFPNRNIVPNNYSKVIRGGSWHNRQESCAITTRNWISQEAKNKFTGFRLARFT